MPTTEWSVTASIFLLLTAVILITFGYLLALVRQGHKVKQINQLLHEKALAQSRAEEQSLRYQESEQRAQQLLAGSQSDLAAVTETLEEFRHSLHTTEKRLEIIQADHRAEKEKVQDLRKRLEQEQYALEQERNTVNQLKEEMAREGKKAEALQTRLDEAQQQLTERKKQHNELQQRHDDLQQKYQMLHTTQTQLKTELSEREASHAREVASFEKQKQSMAEQFKVLSNEILDAKTQALQETSKLSLHAVMNPFQQSIEGFKKEVQEIHHRETTQQGELRKELESLKELNQKITVEAHELAVALRGQKKLQGNWGELVLENVLDRSGLQLGKDYRREVSVTTEEGRQRPDVVVYLPQNRHLIIDAKVSLNAYTRYVNAEDESQRNQALQEHVHAVGSRIKELADRDYFRLPGMNSPEMVFMFIPIESAFVEAMKADSTLFQKAIENHVLVSTPTTLLTSLNIVRQLWRFEDQNQHTAALANKADLVFKKLNTFLSSFERIKKGLENATEAYIRAENQLVSGKGNLVKQVGEFKNLAPAIRAELPTYFVEKAELEINLIASDEVET